MFSEWFEVHLLEPDTMSYSAAAEDSEKTAERRENCFFDCDYSQSGVGYPPTYHTYGCVHTSAAGLNPTAHASHSALPSPRARD